MHCSKKLQHVVHACLHVFPWLSLTGWELNIIQPQLGRYRKGHQYLLVFRNESGWGKRVQCCWVGWLQILKTLCKPYKLGDTYSWPQMYSLKSFPSCFLLSAFEEVGCHRCELLFASNSKLRAETEIMGKKLTKLALLTVVHDRGCSRYFVLALPKTLCEP